ncbi:MAG: polysaccharide lyase family 1 protein [Prevotella sp.]
MKKISSLLYTIAAAMTMVCGTAKAQTWDFTSVSETDKTNLAADADGWTHESTSSNDRYKNVGNYTEEALKANGVELEFTRGLLFTISADDAVRVDIKGARMAMNKVLTITLKNAKKGYRVTMTCKTSKSGTARGVNVTNITPESGSFNSTSADDQTNIGTVTEDGDITITNTGGLYVYSISVVDPETGGSGGGGTVDPADHSTVLNTAQSQTQLITAGNVIKYYNPADISGIAIDKQAGTVTVTPHSGEWNDVFTKSIRNISFSKASQSGNNGDITNNGVEITEAKGWCESVYAKWNIYSEATSYNVYVKGGKYADFTKIDNELVRNYGSYGRADMVGLTAGNDYALKVVPVIGGAEDETKASVAENLEVRNYDRSGFAHFNYSGVGAYNDDGTLKSDARVLYVTAATAKTVSLNVITSNKGTEETFTGFQDIIYGYQKGYETRPLDVRIIGTITDSDMDYFGSSSEGLQIKGKNNSTPMNITVEGIGEDACIWGFGILIRNALSVELRNFGIMLCMDDGVSMDTDNLHCWVHHIDIFYGNTGGDSDQAKGDGTIDIKGDSQYITVAYNHLFDCGKTSLCGMTSESGPNYIDYHHNWFDHSDSRHPRVRTMTVHVWNNYYDGCAKYGVGATTGSSIFVENNYFRNTKNPMLASLQGTDGKGEGTFSGEDGGMIKSFGNVYAEKGTSSNFTPITQKESATDFDCYEAASRDEQVPSSYVTKVGGTTYNNFDTDSNRIYEYTPTAGTDVPSVVTGYWGAGRLNKGDFGWTFNNAVDDADYGVNTEMKNALKNYQSSLVGWFDAN